MGEAASADEANALVLRTIADVALVDLSLRGSSGIEAIRGMLARRPTLKVLVLSMHEGAGYITQALRSGALGYLTKHCEPGDVIDGIHRLPPENAFSLPRSPRFWLRKPLMGMTPSHI